MNFPQQPAERAAKRICAAFPSELVDGTVQSEIARTVLQEIKIQVRRENAEYEIHTAPTRREMSLEALLADFEITLRKRRDRHEDYVDWALYHLLRRWQSELPAPDHYFHKAFRQCDVADSNHGGHTDVAIWSLLNQSQLFWETFEKHNYEPTHDGEYE